MPAMKKSTRKTSQQAVPLLAMVVVVALVGAGVWFVLSNRGGFKSTDSQVGGPTAVPTPTLIPTPTPTPTLLLHGKETYTISQGPEVKGPKITRAVIDPLDPQTGQNQTVTVKVNHQAPVLSVGLKLTTDNKNKTFPLTRISGTDTDGEWQGSWIMEDTYLYNYLMEITAKTTADQSSVMLTIRQRK